MFEAVLEEKCENAFPEHGGPARAPGCQGSHTIGAMRIGRIGLGAASGDGRGRFGPSLRFLPECCRGAPRLCPPTWSPFDLLPRSIELCGQILIYRARKHTNLGQGTFKMDTQAFLWKLLVQVLSGSKYFYSIPAQTLLFHSEAW